jgi:hypothetical protein
MSRIINQKATKDLQQKGNCSNKMEKFLILKISVFLAKDGIFKSKRLLI